VNIKLLAENILRRDSEWDSPGTPETRCDPSTQTRWDRPEMRVTGDLAESIHEHCATCHSCRVEWFTSDTIEPFCPEGRELCQRYRAARVVALGL
jgi:hypothetical protein